ncbi:MAG TPA: DeoR/GlpR family DNA-binding transcription regulator [Flexivirga sp.]|uniref:DeoR/GlpR family DNA-binding transcription regulator n=1 Tax=Flexivirga sp. TaxID=1962927 RepID=UPI002C089D77|nr:DeoR/GlpR family DNA-binding transcription regulator [Flexivirga sp.]HWC20803.1 DeoR/GlpR family DNA-binding transcription regulator [Flexivirga sp.]
MAQDEIGSAAEVRQRQIIGMLQAAGKVDVNELAQHFGVSGMTIRRDLAELDDAGLVHRVHGGAVGRRAPAYGSRSSTMATEKARIARAVSSVVTDHAAVGIDTGTTCAAVAGELAHRSDLTLITNSLHAALELHDTASRVIVLGGVMTRELSLVSSGAAQEQPQIHLDVLVLGCGGLSVDRGVTYFDPGEVEIRRTLCELADRVVVVADHTKFDRKKAIALGDLSVVDVLITDQEPPAHLAERLRAGGATIVVAPD